MTVWPVTASAIELDPISLRARNLRPGPFTTDQSR
jgi:hypothetical protein